MMETLILTMVCLCVFAVPAMAQSDFPVDDKSVKAGTSVHFKGEETKLYDGSLSVGDNFLALTKTTDIEFPFKNKVTIVNIVPSLDTPVCDVQTHQLGESKELHADVDVVTLSRDLPTAQARFAKDAGFGEMGFVSDYKSGAFGKKAGLMMQGKELLARGILVLDKEGVIRYMQIVPEITHLPDVNRAIKEANALAE